MRLGQRSRRSPGPAALTASLGAPAYELEREALGAAILSRLSLLPSSVVALPRRKWRSPGPVPTPPESLHWRASGAGGKEPPASRSFQYRRPSDHNCGSRHLEFVPLPCLELSAATALQAGSALGREVCQRPMERARAPRNCSGTRAVPLVRFRTSPLNPPQLLRLCLPPWEPPS